MSRIPHASKYTGRNAPTNQAGRQSRPHRSTHASAWQEQQAEGSEGVGWVVAVAVGLVLLWIIF